MSYLTARAIAAIILGMVSAMSNHRASSAPTEYSFDFLGPADEMQFAQNAAEQWNACGVVHVIIEPAATAVPIYKVVKIEMHDGLDYIGLYESKQPRIRYRDSIDVQRTIAHEMGHAMGVRHVPTWKHDLMTPYASAHSVSHEDCRLLEMR